MRLRVDQLPAHLQKGLLPLYLISGEEPLQLMEAGDAIRAAARGQGFDERLVLEVEAGFDWGRLGEAAHTLSLFAARRIIELRLPSGKPGDQGGKALVQYAAEASPDNLLLIISGKLDKAQEKSKWFQALDQAGAVVQVWPVEAERLPAWIAARMEQRGMSPSPEAARLLAERVEGNLLAAAQEVEKLRLLFDKGAIGLEQIEAAVAESARYGIFDLVDAALLGDAARVTRMLDGLRGEGEEPVLVLWALAREARTLAAMAREASGQGIEQVLQSHRVWEKRKPAVRAALRRHNARRWTLLVARCARIDRIVKGGEPGNPWDELLQLALLMGGVRVIR